MKRICVFCGSSEGNRPEYKKAAQGFGSLLAKERIGLVFGGASVGLMGAIADAVLAEGGEVIGVIPQFLMDREVAHRTISDLRVVSSMHERKKVMADLSDGFVAMPGGFGTFEEFCEVLTWTQLGLHQKPTGLLNIQGYYDPLIQLFDSGIQEGFIRAQHRQLVISATEGTSLLAQMKIFQPIAMPKWINPKQT